MLPSVRVDLIFQCCNLDYSVQGKDRLDTDDGELEACEFVEGLARLAQYVIPGDKSTPPEKLQKLLEDYVLPNACSVDTDVFRERVGSDRVKDVLDGHKSNLKIIYKAYAADDDVGEAAMSGDTMNANELVSFCRDFKFVGPIMSERSVRVLFAYVQHEEEELEEDEGKEEVGESEMVYAEFVEAMCALGCQLQPDPYNVVEMRIDYFFKRDMMPIACSMLRFRGKGLKKPTKPDETEEEAKKK